MKLTDLEAYEILEQCPLRDLKSRRVYFTP